MQHLGMLEELESTFMVRWGAEDDMVVTSHVALTRARDALAALASASMKVPMRELSLNKVLKVLSNNLFRRDVVLSGLTALGRISLSISAFELLDSECAAMTPQLNRIPELYAADDTVIMLLADATCDIAANSYDGLNRQLLASKGMLTCWLGYLAKGMERNFGAVTMQLALFTLSELCRDSESNVMTLLSHPELNAVDILQRVEDRAREGGFAEGVVLPLVLRTVVRQHTRIMMRTRATREELRDIKSWTQEHYGEHRRLGMRDVRDVAFRPTGMFSGEPIAHSSQMTMRDARQMQTFFDEAAHEAAVHQRESN